MCACVCGRKRGSRAEQKNTIGLGGRIARRPTMQAARRPRSHPSQFEMESVSPVTGRVAVASQSLESSENYNLPLCSCFFFFLRCVFVFYIWHIGTVGGSDVNRDEETLGFPDGGVCRNHCNEVAGIALILLSSINTWFLCLCF